MAPLINQLPCIQKSQVSIYSNYMMVLGGLDNMYGYLTKDSNYVIENTYQIGHINLTIIYIVVLALFVSLSFQ